MQKIQKKINSKAFSLIELSVVILIISILITSVMSVSKSGVNNAKSKVTKERMEVIYEALSNYLAINSKLPCPAELDLTKGNINYGKSLDPTGDCFTDNTGVLSNGVNIRLGAVPFIDLGLSPEIAEDGFGSKFSYVITYELANSSTFDDDFVHGTPNPTPSFIVYNNVTANDSGQNTRADFLIISHGPNRLGSYAVNSTSSFPQPSDIDEDDNTPPGSQTNNEHFVESSARSDVFDDIVKLGVLTNMITKYNLFHVIKCKYTNYPEWDYGTIAARNANTCSIQNEERLCNAFGQSVVVTPCKN